MFWTKKSSSFLPKRVTEALKDNFTRDELSHLASLGTLVELKVGSELTVEDTFGREAMVLVSGTASVVRKGNKVATLEPGEIIGEIALLGGGRRNATVIADCDVEVFALSVREFASLMYHCPQLETRTATAALHRLTAA